MPGPRIRCVESLLQKLLILQRLMMRLLGSVMRLMSLPLDTAGRDLASLPFQLGGCGLLSATRSRVQAHWATLADMTVRSLSEPTGFRHFFDAAASCLEELCNGSTMDWQVFSLECWPHLKKVSAWLPRVSQGRARVAPLPRRSWRHSLSPQCRSVLFSGSIPTSFVCSFCGASVFPFLPVWPSSRLPWPPPCKLCVGRCVGETGLCIGVCSSSSCGIWIWLASAPRTNDALR